MKYIATLNGKEYEIQIEKVPEYQPLSREEAVAPILTSAPVSIATVKPVTASVPKAKPTPTVAPKVKPEAVSTAGGENKVLSPMPGSIFEIKVAEGQIVKKGQLLFVLEAMKMEIEVVAPADGTVTSVMLKKGDVIETGAILAVIK